MDLELVLINAVKSFKKVKWWVSILQHNDSNNLPTLPIKKRQKNAGNYAERLSTILQQIGFTAISMELKARKKYRYLFEGTGIFFDMVIQHEGESHIQILHSIQSIIHKCSLDNEPHIDYIIVINTPS